jgi:hypothetical protein
MSDSKLKEVCWNFHGLTIPIFSIFIHVTISTHPILQMCLNFQLRCDIDELNELVKLAKRKKVQDLLSLEIRKLETEWINLRDSENSSTTPKEVTAVPTTSASVQTKKYQVKLNGYG